MYYFLLLYLFATFIIFHEYNKKVFLIFVALGSILFSGLRYNSGIDYLSYKELYDLAYFSTGEILFWIFAIIHKNIFDSYESFIFIIALFTISVKLYFIYKFNPKYLWFTTLIFICTSYISLDIGLMRNSLSFMFFIVSMYYLYIGNKLTSYFYFFVGFLFHHSIFFMIYIFLLNKNSKVLKYYFFIMILASFVTLLNIQESMISDLSNLEFIKNKFTYFNWKINHYLLNQEYQSIGLSIYVLRIFFLAIIFYLLRKRISDIYFIKIYIIGTCIVLLMGFNIQLYTRAGLYLTLFEIILMSQVLFSFKGWSKIIVGFVLVIMYLILLFRTSYIFEIYKVTFL